jgi:hypothetical protein
MTTIDTELYKNKPIMDAIDITAYAREEDTKKGMDASQITGAASSYARKYALNGLLLIDDTKDADHTNIGQEESKKPTPTIPEPPKAPPMSDGLVTEAQIKRLFTLANKSDKTKAETKEWLSERGMGSSKELNTKQYEELCSWITAPKQAGDGLNWVDCPDGQKRVCDNACPNDTCTGPK